MPEEYSIFPSSFLDPQPSKARRSVKVKGTSQRSSASSLNSRYGAVKRKEPATYACHAFRKCRMRHYVVSGTKWLFTGRIAESRAILKFSSLSQFFLFITATARPAASGLRRHSQSLGQVMKTRPCTTAVKSRVAGWPRIRREARWNSIIGYASAPAAAACLSLP